MPKISIASKLSLFVLIVGIFSATGATTFAWRYATDKFQTTLKDNLLDDSIYIAAILDEQLDFAHEVSHHLALDPDTSETISTHDKDRIVSHFNSHNIDNQFLSLYYINDAGIITYSTDPSFVGLDVSSREYFQDAQNGLHTVTTAIGLRSGVLGYYASDDFTNTVNASDSGVIASKFNPDYIAARIKSAPINDIADISIVDRFGTILHSTNPSLDMYSVGTMTEGELNEIQAYKLYPNTPASLGYEEVKQYLGEYKHPQLFVHKNESNQQYVTLTKIGEHSLYIVLIQNSQGIVKTSRNIAIILGAIIISATILGFISVWKMTDYFLKPIGQISKAAESIAGGNYDVHIDPPKSSDELETIATNINAMIQAIKSSHQALDETVKARTKQLSDRLEELEKFKRLTVKRELKMIELKDELTRLQNESEKNLDK